MGRLVSAKLNAINQVFNIFLNLGREFRYRLFETMRTYQLKYKENDVSPFIQTVMTVFEKFEKICKKQAEHSTDNIDCLPTLKVSNYLSSLIDSSKNFISSESKNFEQMFFEIVLRIFDLIHKRKELSDDELFNEKTEVQSEACKMFGISPNPNFADKLGQEYEWFSNTITIPMHKILENCDDKNTVSFDRGLMQYFARHIINGDDKEDLEEGNSIFSSINQTYMTFKLAYSDARKESKFEKDINEEKIDQAWSLVSDSFNTNVFSSPANYSQSKTANLVVLGVFDTEGRYNTIIKGNQEWHLMDNRWQKSGTLQNLFQTVKEKHMYPNFFVYEVIENTVKRADYDYMNLIQELNLYHSSSDSKIDDSILDGIHISQYQDSIIGSGPEVERVSGSQMAKYSQTNEIFKSGIKV